MKVKDELTVCSTRDIILRGTRLIIPKELQAHVVKLAHEGHQGIVKTKSLLREKVWFPGIDKTVENEVKNCAACLVSTPETKREPLKMSPLPSAPWKEISIDFAELPNGEYLMLVIDDYTRYPVVEMIKSVSANTVIPRLDKILSEFGIPDVLKSDNGPPFNSHDFRSFAQDLGFKHRKVTPLWPRANGEVERLVRTVKKTVKTAKVESKSCMQELNRLLRNYRATPHSTTRVPPATAFFGRPLKTKLPEMSKTTPNPDILESDRVAKAKMKAYADRKCYVRPSPLEKGDTVYVKRDTTKKKKSDTPYRLEPHTIISKKGSMVTASDSDGKNVTRNSSFFKQAPSEIPEEEDPVEEDEEEAIDIPEKSAERRYPQRNRSRPVRLADYV